MPPDSPVTRLFSPLVRSIAHTLNLSEANDTATRFSSGEIRKLSAWYESGAPTVPEGFPCLSYHVSWKRSSLAPYTSVPSREAETGVWRSYPIRRSPMSGTSAGSPDICPLSGVERLSEKTSLLRHPQQHARSRTSRRRVSASEQAFDNTALLARVVERGPVDASHVGLSGANVVEKVAPVRQECGKPVTRFRGESRGVACDGGAPPAAEILQIGPFVAAVNRMTLSAFQEPPRPAGASASVTTRSAARSIRFSLPPAKNPNER